MYDDWNTDHRRWWERCLLIRGDHIKKEKKLNCQHFIADTTHATLLPCRRPTPTVPPVTPCARSAARTWTTSVIVKHVTRAVVHHIAAAALLSHLKPGKIGGHLSWASKGGGWAQWAILFYLVPWLSDNHFLWWPLIYVMVSWRGRTSSAPNSAQRLIVAKVQ